jgi:hypothetical protein
MLVALVVAALVSCVGIGICPSGAAAQETALTVSVRDGAGRPVRSLHVGERLVVHGTLAPAAVGEPLTVTVTGPRGQVVRTPSVSSVDPSGSGAFRTSLRATAPGVLTVVAVAGDVTSNPVTVSVARVGRPMPGCGGPATVAGERSSRPPRSNAGPLRKGALLWPGAVVRLRPHARVRLQRGQARYRTAVGRFRVDCRALELLRGSMRATAARHGRARVLLAKALATSRAGGRLSVDAGPRRFHFASGTGTATSSAAPRLTLRSVPGDTVLEGRDGLLRMDTWPFAESPDERRLRRSAVPEYWADGWPCAVGCRPAGALDGWPLKPFHQAHPLRAGLNEWRPANMHIGLDIQALDGTPVYALQSGTASIAGAGTVDVRVRVGSYEYWHVHPLVHGGQYVRAHRTVIGRIIPTAGHVHLSEIRGDYLNLLRPGGTVLKPYRDTEAPVIGVPRRVGGQVFVEAFDPQSLRATLRYRTPVLAPAAVAWRAHDARGHAITPLRFAYRGSHHYPTGAKSLIYGPGTIPPFHIGATGGGWSCLWRYTICVPKWNYRLWGVPAGAKSLSVYAWDWAGNVAERTSALRSARPSAPAAATGVGGTGSDID